MWIRPNSSLVNGMNTTQVFLDITDSFRCQFYQQNKTLTCRQMNYDNFLTPINMTMISDIQSNAWIHFTIAGHFGNNITYMRLDYQDQSYQVVNTTYITMRQRKNPWYAYLGIDRYMKNGFKGDIREFLFTQQYINSSQVMNIKNQVLQWNTLDIGNYRLQNADIMDTIRFSELSSTMVYQSSSAAPTSSYDVLPIDMCYDFYNQTTLPYINTNKVAFSSEKIDARLQPTVNLAYSGSFWMKTYPGIKTTTDPQTARLSLYFFRLEEAFDLWFNNDTSIRIFFHAEKNVYETSSSPVYFPQKQWANLQFYFERVSGYEMRVYNFQRRLVAKVSDSKYLQDQDPTGYFTIAQNFQGYIKQIMVYNSKKSLPIADSNGQYGVLKDNNLIIYYKFDQGYFNTYYKAYESLGNNTAGNVGPSITMTGSYTWDKVEWNDDMTFSNPGTSGLLTQAFSNYDGLACNITRAYYRTSTRRSYISSQLTLNDDLTSATLEFWFKKNETQTNSYYLFTLTDNDYMEYISIYVKDGQSLVCMPVNSTTFGGPFVEYSNWTSSSTAWQHIACKFKNSYMVEGSLYNDNDSTDFFYKSDISTDTVYLAAQTYNIYLGNNNSTLLGPTNTFFKEVRLWQRSLSFYNIKKYRFSQFDATKQMDLLSYFKMTTADYSIKDYVGFPNVTASTSEIIQDIDYTPNVVCPQYSYSYQNTSCKRNPFIKQQIVVLAQVQSSNTLYWNLTSLYSDMWSYYAQKSFDNYTFAWEYPTSFGTANNSKVAQYQNQSSLIIPSDLTTSTTQGTTTSNSIFFVKQTIMDPGYSFFTNANLTFTLSKCRYLADQTTNSAVSEINIADTPGSYDLNMTFSIKTTCTSTDTLSTTMDWNVYPSHLNITGISYVYSSAKQSFTITIPKSQQTKFILNQPVIFIGTVYWNSTSTTNNGQTNQQGNTNTGNMMTSTQNNNFLNMIYTVTFIDNLTPLITTDYRQVPIGLDLVLYASNSYANSVNDSVQATNALNYRWMCPTQFRTVCNSKTLTDNMLTISYNEFLSLGLKYLQNYTFSLTVWKDTDPSDQFSFTGSYNIQWIQAFKPNFTVEILNGQSQILASKDSSLQINLMNYNYEDTSLTVSWVFDMAIVSSSKNLVYGKNNTMLTIKKGALYADTAYNLNITVTNKNYPSIATSYVYTFYTGVLPYNGTVTLNNPSGVAMSTIFNISLSGWVSLDDAFNSTDYNTSITYKVYGISNTIASPFLITQDAYYQNISFVSMLPQMKQLYIEITDEVGEVTSITKDVSISDNQYVNVIGTISSDMTYSQILDRFIIGIYSVNQLTYNTYSSTILSNKVNMLNYMSTTLSTYLSSSTESSVSKSTYVKKSMTILQLITNNSLNATIYTSAKTILTTLKSSSEYSDLLSDYTFQQAYITLIGNLLSYQTGAQVSSSSKRRMLATSVQDSIELIHGAADDYCDTQFKSSYSGVQQGYSTTKAYIIVEKIALPYLGFNRTYIYPADNQTVQVPLDQISALERSINNKTNYTCIEVIFFNTNPLSDYTFYNQTVQSNFTMSFNTINDQKLRALSQNNGYSLPAATFIQKFNYDFNKTNSTFLTNQTACEYINNSLTDYTNKNWSYKNYNYQYNVDTKQIHCYGSFINQSYFAIVNDLSRQYGVIEEDEGGFFSILLSFDHSVIPILAVLGIFWLFVPIIAIYLDSSNEKSFEIQEEEGNSPDIGNMLVNKIAEYQNLSPDVVLYRKKTFSWFYTVDESLENDGTDKKRYIPKTSFTSKLTVLVKYIHPLFSLFTKYEFDNKRLVRYMFLAFQISIIAFICTAAFGTQYRKDEQDDTERETNYDSQDLQNAIIAGCILSILTLPLPYKATKCCRKKVVDTDNLGSYPNEENEDDQSMREDEKKLKAGSESKVTDHLADGVGNDGNEYDNDKYESPASNVRLNTRDRSKRGNKQFEGGSDEDAEGGDEGSNHGGQEENNEEVSHQEDEIERVKDSCHCFKLFLVALSWITIMGAVVFVAYTSNFISKANSKTIVIAYFTALLVGWLVVNIFRVLLSVCFAPKIVKMKKNSKDGTGLSGCNDICAFYFISHDAVEVLTDMDLVHEILDNPNPEQMSQNGDHDEEKHQTNKDYKLGQQQIKPGPVGQANKKNQFEKEPRSSSASGSSKAGSNIKRKKNQRAAREDNYKVKDELPTADKKKAISPPKQKDLGMNHDNSNLTDKESDRVSETDMQEERKPQTIKPEMRKSVMGNNHSEQAKPESSRNQNVQRRKRGRFGGEDNKPQNTKTANDDEDDDQLQDLQRA